MKTTIRELRPSDMQSFADLTDTRDNLSTREAQERAELVEWVAFKNPTDDGNPHYFVGVQGDRVVAHLGRMPTIFQINNTLEMASYFHDLYVHPELRSQGAQGFFLSMKMYRKAEAASKSFSAMIWTNQINIALQKARKYTQLWTDQRVMILGLKTKIESHISGPVQRPALRAARTLIRAAVRANSLRLPAQGTVEQIERFDARFDDFLDRASAHIGICPQKTSDYLNWKYADRPQIDSVSYQLLDESGRLAGYCIIVEPDKTGTGSIAELTVVDNDKAGMHALLEQAISHLGESGADRVEAVATGPLYGSALHERLFRRVKRVPLFLAHVDRSPNRALLLSPSNWHMGLGDSEGPF